jgi:hypothetical protein
MHLGFGGILHTALSLEAARLFTYNDTGTPQ